MRLVKVAANATSKELKWRKDEREETSTDQRWGWGQGEEILSSAKCTPSWPGSSHNNQSPTHLPPSSPQHPSKRGFLLGSLHAQPFAWA